MLTTSKNMLQEEWVQSWLDKLTPKQKALVIDVLKDGNKRRAPTPAAMQEANAAVTPGDPKYANFLFYSQSRAKAC